MTIKQRASDICDRAVIEEVLQGNLSRLIGEGRSLLKPRTNETVSEWADRNRVLPETSVEPGRWRTARLPHSRGIMDTVCDPRVHQVTIMKSAQVGGTEIMNNIIGYIIDQDPRAIIIMQPTDKDARDYSESKLEPMIEDTVCLRGKIQRRKSRDKQNKILRKKYPGGHLSIVSGNSVSSTRQRSAPVTFGDDIDGIPIAPREGDPVLRLMKRSTTYPDHLNFNISTPGRSGESRIEILFEQGNMQRFYVRCPGCGFEQVLKWENLRWKKDIDLFGKVSRHYPETVMYECEKPECKRLISEAERMAMLQSGRWIADRPSMVFHQSFWINELSSTLSTMERVARAIVDAGENEDKLEALYNTVFGLPYSRIRGEQTDPIKLMERIEDYVAPDRMVVPQDVLVMTAAVDVQAGAGEQDARLEVTVVGWGAGEEAWVLFHGRISGNVQQRLVWQKLDEFIAKKWQRSDGVEMRVRMTFVDSGYLPQTVYDYVRGREYEGIYAIKGANKYGASLLQRKASLVDKGRTRLIVIGTQAAKMDIYSRLNNVTTMGPKYFHFSKSFCGAEYFQQLTAEVPFRRNTGLMDYVYYDKKNKHDSNEALDLMVYNYAAMKFLNINWASLEMNMRRRAGEARQPEMRAPAKAEARQEVKETVKPRRRMRMVI